MLSCRALFLSARSSRSAISKRLLNMKGGSIPESEEMKPFYALGINVARQVRTMNEVLCILLFFLHFFRLVVKSKDY